MLHAYHAPFEGGLIVQMNQDDATALHGYLVHDTGEEGSPADRLLSILEAFHVGDLKRFAPPFAVGTHDYPFVILDEDGRLIATAATREAAEHVVANCESAVSYEDRPF